MTIQRPSAAITLEGGGAPSLIGGALSLAQSAVARLGVDLSVGEAHDRVELALWGESPLAGAEPGASIAVGLGDNPDTVEDVLLAEVAGVDATSWGAVLTAFAPSRRLSATYVGRAYVDQSLEDVVADLLSEAGVDAGDIDAALPLPVLHVDPRRTVWANLHSLARRSGHQITSDPDGAVSFTPVPGSASDGLLSGVASALGLAPSTELRAGAELLDFRTGPRPRDEPQAVVTPSGGTGKTWHLLAAEPDSGTSAPVLIDPALRTQEAADAATAALEAVSRRRARVATARVPGRPGLRGGTTVTVREEDLRIVRVRHCLDARAGYVCDLELEGDR